MDYTKLSKTVSYILRHEPEKYGLQLENEGWVEIECLCRAVEQDDFKKVTKFDLITMIGKSKKRRHEIVDSKIRATYGHSVNSKINYEKSIPPEFLYHGTARRFIENILKEGLISKDRQYVHLSSDLETAISVGKRYDDKPILLKINAIQCCDDGNDFYFANETIWLANEIPPKYVMVMENFMT